MQVRADGGGSSHTGPMNGNPIQSSLEDDAMDPIQHDSARVPREATTPRRFMEHRWGRRVALDMPVHITLPGGDSAVGVLRDASISGGFIETPLHLAVGAPLGVVLLVGAGAARRAVDLPACVTRKARDGLAIEWRDMASPPVLALLRASGAELAHLTGRDRVFS